MTKKYNVSGEGMIRVRGKVVKGVKTYNKSMGKIYYGTFGTIEKARDKTTQLKEDSRIIKITIHEIDTEDYETYRSNFKSGNEVKEYHQVIVSNWERN